MFEIGNESSARVPDPEGGCVLLEADAMNHWSMQRYAAGLERPPVLWCAKVRRHFSGRLVLER